MYRNSYTATLNPTFAGGNRGNGNGNGNGHGHGPNHHLMSSSMPSLSSSMSPRSGRRTHGNGGNNISKIYRQASTLFLTRRLPEALTTLLPLITPPFSGSEGGSVAGDAHDGNTLIPTMSEPAPVASASRTTRVKVWSLYLTVLNAILELEPDEGKDAFGTQDWRALCSKVRDGDVWDEVVRNGYHGVEGDVDADVVINLATLLLAHAKSQVLNQQRLEAYLSHTPSFDLSGRFDQRRSLSRARRSSSASASAKRGAMTPGGTDTPRDLNARVKILELYTLHVLLRNDSWDDARDFITASPILDEERREAFLQALQSLQDEQVEQQEEQQRQEEEHQRALDEERRIRAENEERERRRLEEERAERARRASVASAATASDVASSVGHRPSSAGSVSGGRGDGGSVAGSVGGSGKLPKRSASRKRKSRNKAVAAPARPTSLGARTALLFANVRAFVEQLSAALQTNPATLMRTLFFLVALLVALGRRATRERLRQILGSSWNKIRATAGMGVKVSYI